MKLINTKRIKRVYQVSLVQNDLHPLADDYVICKWEIVSRPSDICRDIYNFLDKMQFRINARGFYSLIYTELSDSSGSDLTTKVNQTLISTGEKRKW